MRVANAHNDPGPDGLKMFNIGYLAGITGILLAWNSAMLIKVTVSDEYLRYTALCLKKTLDSKSFIPAPIMLTLISLCIFFSLMIIRRTKKYLNKLPESQLRNLPAKNALTYIDTLILFYVLSGSLLMKTFSVFLFTVNTSLYDQAKMIIGIISIIVDDIGVAFIFPIYIIMKTKRYLPKLWDDSRQIILENNDFYSSNPNAVAPWQSTNQQRAETRF